MKGIMLNLLEGIITTERGADAWDDMLDGAELKGAYTSLGDYPDEQLAKLVRVAALHSRDSEENFQKWFGKKAIGPMSELYPSFFDCHEETLSFVLTLNTIIHPQVRDLYPGAVVPVFRFETLAQQGLVLHYQSPRMMCKFAEGLIEGAAEYFGEHVSLHQPTCVHHGASACAIHCTFGPIRE
jgi:hypothetical protein